jgi:type I restriction enzyme M protein
LAVVGLHGNSFKPHTGTKTSVLFVQKWHPTLCPRREDYPIFFATQQREGKNNSGDKVFWKRDLSGSTTNLAEMLHDAHGHPIVYHDLFSTQTDPQENHPNTPLGIAEAFMEFAQKERLSFF